MDKSKPVETNNDLPDVEKREKQKVETEAANLRKDEETAEEAVAQIPSE